MEIHHGAAPRLQDSWTLECTGHYRLGTEIFKKFFGKVLVHMINFQDQCRQ